MGHLINPSSNRLSLNLYWNSNWSVSSSSNYIYLYKKDYLLFYYLDWFISKSKFIRLNFLISHYKIYRTGDKVFINLYFYNGSSESKDFDSEQIEFNKILSKISNYKSIDTDKNITFFYKYITKFLISNLYWFLLTEYISLNLKKLSNDNDKFYFNIYNLDFLNLTAEGVSNYISVKLQNKHSLNWVLRPILRDLSIKIDQKNILGYKILCSGRFTRKQIATRMWMKNGLLKLNTLSNLVKYSSVNVRLKYGICGIKVWINYGSNEKILFPHTALLVYPFYSPFKYSFNQSSNSFNISLNYWFFMYLRVLSFKTKSYNYYSNYMTLKFKLLLYNILKSISNKENPFLNLYEVLPEKNNKLVININKGVLENKSTKNYIYE